MIDCSILVEFSCFFLEINVVFHDFLENFPSSFEVSVVRRTLSLFVRPAVCEHVENASDELLLLSV